MQAEAMLEKRKEQHSGQRNVKIKKQGNEGNHNDGN